MINVILQFLGLHLVNIKFSANFYQNIPNGVRDKFRFFRIWTSAKPRPIANVIWQSHGLPLINTYVYANVHHNILLSSRDRAIFFYFFFRIWSSAKPRPMKNDISQSLGLDLDSINVYEEVYQNIPLSSRNKVIFTFSEFALGKFSTDDKCHFVIVSLFSESEPRQKRNQSQMSFDNLMGYILSISVCMQNFITIFHLVKKKTTLSLFFKFGTRQSLDRWKMSFRNLLG